LRRIAKTHPPSSFLTWKRTETVLGNCTFKNLQDPQKGDLKAYLLKEQGYLCAYTGRRISPLDSHLEHLKPQTECSTGEDVDYRNLVACFPGDGGDKSYGYGAPVKADWWDSILFVSPISHNCERNFVFEWSGKIKASTSTAPALETIKRLGLDHDDLTKLRRKAIAGFFGFGKGIVPLSTTEASRLRTTIDRLDAQGKLTEYCFVLAQLLAKYKTP
jgi:uncharacterized protein (TIGR02646 family)